VRALLTLGALVAVLVLGAPMTALAADPPDPGSVSSFTYGDGDAAYPYLVYVPKSYDASKATPLLVMAHGCQTTAEQQMKANRYGPIAEREGFIVMYPDINPVEAAQPGATNRCWQFPNPLSWHRDSGDAGAIAGMTRATMAQWNIDPERVYLMGMSAGSFMTSDLAAAYPDLYAAVGIMAGGAYADGGCLFTTNTSLPVDVSASMAFDEMGPRARVVPRLVMGGDADQGVPPGCADKALEQGLRTNNLVLGGTQESPIALTPTSVREQPKPGGYPSTVKTYTDPAGCVVGQRWLIHGMNHFWSGGSDDPKLKDFTDPKGPSGAEISWAFFSHYTKSSTAMPCAETGQAAANPTPPPVTTPKRCSARWLTLGLRAAKARATVNGRRVSARVVHGRVRVRLPATQRTETTVLVHARTRAGKRVTRRFAAGGCGF
jgi:poly(hydroxyalkanoate) depolymerase family esterase